MLPIQKFSAGVLAEIVRRQPASAERTSFAWQIAVGAAISRSTTVDVVEGVMVVTARDVHWARAVERAAPTILARMQHLLGAQAITAIKVAAAR